jgi:hypothetical protein
MSIELNDQNSLYVGDGVYAHKDKHGRLWAVTHNGYDILDKICLEHEVFDGLLRFYRGRILNESEGTD